MTPLTHPILEPPYAPLQLPKSTHPLNAPLNSTLTLGGWEGEIVEKKKAQDPSTPINSYWKAGTRAPHT